MAVSSSNVQRTSCISTSKSRNSNALVACSSSQKVLEGILPLKTLCSGGGLTNQVLCFLLKVAALETIRRITKPRFPFVWRAVQAMQMLCYPPFKWIQKLGPLKLLVNGVEKISRPLMFLSVTTEIYDHYEDSKKLSDEVDHSRSLSELHNEDSTSELADARLTSDTINFNESAEETSSNKALAAIHTKLIKHGINLPERITQDELQRFYTAENGDFSRLFSSLKRTIRWRETYHILSRQELETWSHLVFWHGLDKLRHPCLIIRIGLAISSLIPQDRPRFAQAIVSQLEFGVLNLVNDEDSRITVLMDCDGLASFKLPMHMLRSCSNVVQENYPNRLASLYVIRLPPFVRVLAQTFIKFVKPTTRKKVHFQGDEYLKALSELLQTVPQVLGGDCTCPTCEKLLGSGSGMSSPSEVDLSDGDEMLHDLMVESGSNSCERVLRSCLVALLLIWIAIAFHSGMINF